MDDHVAGDKTCEVSEGDNTRETDMAIVGVSKDVADDDNQPLSMWFGGMQFSKNVKICF